MFAWTPRFKIRIDNTEIFNFLTELNGVEPTQWFITKNGGKNKKDVLAYIFNNTPEHIQLIAIKGKKRNCYIDKESVVTYSKTEDIDTLTVARGEFYEIKIKLKNGTKYILGAFPYKTDAFHKESMKAFRTEYKEASKKEQAQTIALNVLIYLVSIVIGVSIYLTGEKLGNRYQYAKSLQMFIENREYERELSVVLKSYDKQNLKLDGNYTTIETGNFKLNLPESYKKYVAPDYNEEESASIIYKHENDEYGARVLIDKEPYVGQDYNEIDERIGNACEKEFGFRIDSHYNYYKLMWVLDCYNGDINYFDPEELVLYGSMASTKAAFVGAITEVYEVETSTYKGILSILDNNLDNDVVFVLLDACTHDDLNTMHRITFIIPRANIDEAYKILNSVELIEE